MTEFTEAQAAASFRLIDRGELKDMPEDQRFIILNPRDVPRAKDLLDPQILKAYGRPIDYEMYQIPVDNSQHLVALTSADPKFYFGMRENRVLYANEVKHFIGQRGGGFGDMGGNPIPEIVKRAPRLGVISSAPFAAERPVGPTGGRAPFRSLLPAAAVAGTALTVLLASVSKALGDTGHEEAAEKVDRVAAEANGVLGLTGGARPPEGTIIGAIADKVEETLNPLFGINRGRGPDGKPLQQRRQSPNVPQSM